MSNTHPTGPQGQHPFGPQGQSSYPQQGQPVYPNQGEPQLGPQGQVPYGWTGQPLSPEQAAAQARAAKAYAKAQRPWFKKKRFVVPIGAAALMTVIGIGGGGSESTATPQPGTSASADKPTEAKATEAKATEAKAEDTAKAEDAAKAEKAPAEKAEVAAIGDSVKSGDFKVTITKVRDGGKKVGNEYVNEKAQGHFVLVDVKVKNNGDRADYFSSGDVKLTDDKGREFSVDEMASIYVSDSNPLLEEINPGNTSKGTFAFDLPKGVDAEQAQISAGGLFDGPVTVELS
ncbi:MAG TPA: DUF4352 domain-containing protein [Microlunatus sp.]